VERTARILIVDDDPDFVAATKKVLESKPYEVLVAYDGDEGLQKTREEKPDLIILDIIMPREDGFRVCEEIKGDPQLAEIPVIILTSLSQRWGETVFSVTQGLTREAEDYIDKPVAPAELLRRVEERLEELGF
jgi:DNA-binding response OmpR family regulator